MMEFINRFVYVTFGTIIYFIPCLFIAGVVAWCYCVSLVKRVAHAN